MFVIVSQKYTRGERREKGGRGTFLGDVARCRDPREKKKGKGEKKKKKKGRETGGLVATVWCLCSLLTKRFRGRGERGEKGKKRGKTEGEARSLRPFASLAIGLSKRRVKHEERGRRKKKEKILEGG